MFDVAIFGGKRLDTIPVKFSELEKKYLQEIGANEDRPLGYIVRELAFRGLTSYLKDKNIRANLIELENLAERKKLEDVKVIQLEKINKTPERKKKAG